MVSAFTYRQLRAEGLTRRRIELLLRDGVLTRVRRGRYVPGDVDGDVLRAARLGGRLDCVSLLASLGVFVMDGTELHVQFDRGGSRLPRRGSGIRSHWRTSSAGADRLCTDIVEALAQAVRCQHPRAGIATLDSAWNKGLVDADGLAAVFARLPRRHRRLRGLVDRSAESGPETFVRLMLRALGVRWSAQVPIAGVGRVDFLVDGWLIVECDSRAFHSTWAEQRRDRARDRAAAAAGYATLRLLAEEILYQPEAVQAALVGVLRRPGRRR